MDIDAILQRARDGAQKIVPDLAARAAADGARGLLNGSGPIRKLLGY